MQKEGAETKTKRMEEEVMEQIERRVKADWGSMAAEDTSDLLR